MDILVSVHDNVKNWMKEKGEILTISKININACCMRYADAQISYKAPEKENYYHIQQDDLSIYIEKGLQFKDNRLTLSLMGIGPFKSIILDGLKRY
ncbi:hypothetical protein SAMN05877753_102651 [Bacillus oleivorans]|uniref:Uncharacterized protein n=1 Tax=Bacillus oleivorans TaxID=1448271 RepID=A0A285CNW5_9BACI|nr:CC/Se motif family (seleno)protein [Bacillus oleivorans]SNX68673.1 hypothetical protein SAMN05877753_102651 [Bacillus oleivorans]